MEKHFKSFLKASIIVGIAVILSRVLGLVREQYSLYLFGAGWELDAYISAYKLPTFLRNMLGEGAFSVVFTAMFSVLYLKNPKKAKVFTNRILSYLILISFSISIIALIYTPNYMNLIHKSAENFELAVALSRIMVFFINFISLSAIFMGILNSWENYFIPAFAPAVGNIFNILIIYFFHDQLGIYVLGVGYLLNSFVLMVIQIPFIFRNGFKFKFDFVFDRRIKIFFKSFLPVAFGMAFFQVNQLLTNIFSSQIEGGNSVMDKASLIIQMAIAILSTGISVVLLSMTSRAYNNKEKSKLFKDSVKTSFLVVFPVTILFMIFSYDISSFIFKDVLFFFGLGLGKISEEAIGKIGQCIFFFAPGITIYTMIVLATRTFQGMKKFSSPLIGSVISTMINLIIMTIFFKEYGLLLLPISVSIAACIDLIILIILLKFQLKEKTGDEMGFFFIKNFLAGILMGFIIYYTHMYVHPYFSNIMRLPMMLFLGIICYFSLLIVLREKNIINLLKSLRKSH